MIQATPATLKAVLSALTVEGETVVLAAGDYTLDLRTVTLPKGTTLDARLAVFRGASLKAVFNLAIRGGEWRNSTPADVALKVLGGADISVTGAHFIGPEVKAHGQPYAQADGKGISFDKTDNASVADCLFKAFAFGVTGNQCRNITIRASRFTRMRSDGFQLANCWGGLVESNVFDGTDTVVQGPTAPHPDAGQLFNVAGVAPTSGIVVRNNTSIGDSQGFTGFSKETTGSFVDCVFEENDVIGSHPQGIALYDGLRSTVRNNRVRTMPGSPFFTNLVTTGDVLRYGNMHEPALGKRPLPELACPPQGA